jgi:uncharacterized protein (DUF3084 family)
LIAKKQTLDLMLKTHQDSKADLEKLQYYLDEKSKVCDQKGVAVKAFKKKLKALEAEAARVKSERRRLKKSVQDVVNIRNTAYKTFTDQTILFHKVPCTSLMVVWHCTGKSWSAAVMGCDRHLLHECVCVVCV